MKRLRIPFSVLTPLFIACTLLSSVVNAQAEEQGRQRTVTVTGSGQVSVTPDVAVVTLGVETEAEDAARALDANSEAMRDLIATLKENGIAAADIQTSSINLYPSYRQDQFEGGAPEIGGYIAANTVRVRVRDLTKLGTLLDAAVAAGGNTIQGISFEVSDPTLHLDRARELAVEDAERKAQRLASLVDAELGEVLTLSETITAGQPFPMESLEMDAAVPVEPGSQALTVNVQVTWSLE